MKTPRRFFKFTIAAKIFFGFVIILLLMFIANTYLFSQIGALSNMVNEIGTSARLVSVYREMLATLNTVDRRFKSFPLVQTQALSDKIDEEINCIISLLDSISKYSVEEISENLARAESLKIAFSKVATDDKYASALWERNIERLSNSLALAVSFRQKASTKQIGDAQKMASQSRLYGIILLGVVFFISIGAAIIVAKNIARPIGQLREATHYARLGKYNRRVPIITSDEIAELTMDFNAMLEALSKLEKMKSMFLASISHDLKSPLYRAKLAVENLEDGIYGKLTEQQKKITTQILHDLDTLSHLIHDILDLQKLEDGRFELHLENTNIEQFIRELIQKHAISFANKGVGLSLCLDLEVKETHIDPRQLLRVFENLLSNALKFTPSGGKVTITATSRGHIMHFIVADTGTGIPPEESKKIFDKFYRASSSKNISGTGLGLTIAKQLVEAHNGRIWCETEIGKGTEFHFTIPIK